MYIQHCVTVHTKLIQHIPEFAYTASPSQPLVNHKKSESVLVDNVLLDTRRVPHKLEQPGKRTNDGDEFNRQYMKKRADLRKDLIDSDLARKHAAIDIQKSLSSRNIKRKIPSDKNDPLVQIKLKEERKSLGSKLQNRMKMAQESRDSGKQRKLLVDKVVGPFGKQPTSSPLEKKPQSIAVLGDFDMESYLGAQKMVKGDAMKSFQFNQIVSDATRPDRYLKDYRNSK